LRHQFSFNTRKDPLRLCDFALLSSPRDAMAQREGKLSQRRKGAKTQRTPVADINAVSVCCRSALRAPLPLRPGMVGWERRRLNHSSGVAGLRLIKARLTIYEKHDALNTSDVQCKAATIAHTAPRRSHRGARLFDTQAYHRYRTSSMFRDCVLPSKTRRQMYVPEGRFAASKYSPYRPEERTSLTRSATSRPSTSCTLIRTCPS
jgi:hypothetical protein